MTPQERRTNNFAESYGLIVIVNKTQVVLIERTIPYVILQYLIVKRKKTLDFADFLEHYLPKQRNEMKLDFRRYESGRPYEDQFDFPHGQKENVEKDPFSIAFREFREETGYTFDIPLPLPPPSKTIEFTGLDGFHYKQTFFVVHVASLRECPAVEEKHYSTHIVDISKARCLLGGQQFMKRDGKHLLI